MWGTVGNESGRPFWGGWGARAAERKAEEKGVSSSHRFITHAEVSSGLLPSMAAAVVKTGLGLIPGIAIGLLGVSVGWIDGPGVVEELNAILSFSEVQEHVGTYTFGAAAMLVGCVLGANVAVRRFAQKVNRRRLDRA